MCFFKSRKSNFSQEMIDSLSKYKLDYLKKHENHTDAVAPIFSDAVSIIRKASEKQLIASMKQTNNSAESGALSILQNCSLLRIKPKSGSDFISSSLLQSLSAEDVAYDLYCYVK